MGTGEIMGMKIQAINRGDGLYIEVDKTYYVDDGQFVGECKVTHLEIISAPTASGIEIRAEIQNPVTENYIDISLDSIHEEAR